MDRLLHHELRFSLTAVVAMVVSVVVVGPVRGFPSVNVSYLSTFAGALALWVLLTLLRATRIPWFGEVRDFDAATPVDPETALPTEDFWHDRPVNLGFLPVLLVPALGLALAWEAWMCLMPLVWGLEVAAKAARVAHWERENGRVLWRGRVEGRPWELSYSPVGHGAPARTTTDAPPS
ncbi:hypothetical protein ACH4TV_17000 [Streptomyces sp. NPDC020898]|uniref:hypothetical protein n=1 Tax=Streptomyces sp. NPDC020898 TaxID=3365101 RepID=UPI00378E9058